MGTKASLFSYYTFVENYKREPFDIDDYVDGLQAIFTRESIKAYLEKKSQHK